MVELMAAKFAELWRRRMMERPRDDAQLKPRLTAAGKRKPRRAGFSDFSRVYQRQIRRGPQGVGRNQQRRPHAPQLRRQPPQGPRCQPSPQPPATCVINDCCSNGKSEAGNAPASKEISATIQPAAIADGFKNMEKSPRFDRNQTNIIRLAVQIKTRACSERVARLFRSEHAPTL